MGELGAMFGELPFGGQIGAVLVLGYLLGSIPFGLLLTRLGGAGDIRSIGSGNIGATNVLRTGRKGLAAATLVLDGGKAALAFFLAKLIAGGGEAGHGLGLIAGAAAFVGHCFPVWLGFKGGKGVATYFGLLLAAMPLVGLWGCGTWLTVAFVFRFSSLAALVASVVAVPLAALLLQPPLAVAVIAVLAALLWWRHGANLSRLLAGTEPKIGGGSKPA
jgi:glycerol-3-phosphate acyltransferase PlsY